eukprot:1724757-Rhodomonas_salina.3
MRCPVLRERMVQHDGGRTGPGLAPIRRIAGRILVLISRMSRSAGRILVMIERMRRIAGRILISAPVTDIAYSSYKHCIVLWLD